MSQILVDMDAHIDLRVAAARAVGGISYVVESADMPDWVRNVLARHVAELDAARKLFDAAEQPEVEHA